MKTRSWRVAVLRVVVVGIVLLIITNAVEELYGSQGARFDWIDLIGPIFAGIALLQLWAVRMMTPACNAADT